MTLACKGTLLSSLEDAGYSKKRISEIFKNFEKKKKEITIYEAEEKFIKSNY